MCVALVLTLGHYLLMPNPLGIICDMYRESNLHVLLIEPNVSISEMVSFVLENKFGATVFTASDPKSSLHFLSVISGLDLIIIDNLEGATEDEKHKTLTSFLNSASLEKKCRIILAADTKSDSKNASSDSLRSALVEKFLGVVDRKNLINEVSALIQANMLRGEITESEDDKEFCRIRIQLLLFVYVLPADVFLRLSDKNYLKIYKKGDQFHETEFEHCKETMRSPYLHVRRADLSAFVSTFDQATHQLLDETNVDPVMIRSMSLGIQSALQGIVQKFGVTEEVRLLTKNNVELLLKSVSKTPKLSEIFQRISSESSQYIVSHSIELGEIACILASHMSWVSDVTFKKLILAALFHDILLKNHELAKIQSLRELNDHPELLLHETRKDFLEHPGRAAELINSLGEVPPDVGNAIRHHHEKPDGSGFPAGLTGQTLPPISCLFILAHEYIDFVHNESDRSFMAFLAKNRYRYNSGYFKRIAKTLEEKLKQTSEL